jgi:hypothetical protein
VPFDQPFEHIDEFERELRQSLERQPAPLSLKQKVMERRLQNNGQILSIHSATHHRTRMIWLERLAASLVVAAVAGGAVFGHYADERRRGEEAKQQVLTALRITNRALDLMSEHLAEQDNQKQ